MLTGDDEANFFWGFGGDDEIRGGYGRDQIYGGDGDDSIFGDGDSDFILGGAGDDTISGGAGSDNINGGLGNDRIDGGSGNDRIDGGSGNDRIDGGRGNDTIDGDANNDTIDAGTGNDEIDGGDGNDTINGGDGSDTIEGGAGDDTIDGGDGSDTIDAGTGQNNLTGGGTEKDTFVVDFTQTADADYIIDFDTSDVLRLTFNVTAAEKTAIENGSRSLDDRTDDLETAADLLIIQDRKFDHVAAGHRASDTNDATANDTIIYATQGTAATNDDVVIVVLEDYDVKFTIEDLDLTLEVV